MLASSHFSPKRCRDAFPLFFPPRRRRAQGAATTSALSEKGHRTGVKSELGGGRAGVHPEGKDSTHRGPASQAEVKRDRKPGSNRNSSSQPSRTGHRRGVIAKTSNPVAAAGGGGRGVRRGGTPLAEPATTSSLNAEIRGLFERATKVHLASYTFDKVEGVASLDLFSSYRHCRLSRGTHARKLPLTKILR